MPHEDARKKCAAKERAVNLTGHSVDDLAYGDGPTVDGYFEAAGGAGSSIHM